MFGGHHKKINILRHSDEFMCALEGRRVAASLQSWLPFHRTATSTSARPAGARSLPATMLLHWIAVVASCLSLDVKAANETEAQTSMFGLSKTGEEVQFNLIDGEDADIERYPFYAMIVKKKSAIKTINSGAKLKLFCGSSLIHSRFILTAFHCFKKKPYPAAWIAVFHVVDRCHPVGFRTVEVANIFFHVGSTTSSFAKINDLALAELKRPVTDIKPVNLPKFPPIVGRVGMLIGFGRVELKKKKTDKEVPCILKMTSQTVEHPDRCRHVHEQVVHAFCSKSIWRPMSMACRGDSGGPWLVSGDDGYEVQGLSSFGAADCKPESENDHYTSVFLFVPWIKEIIAYSTNGSAQNPVEEGNAEGSDENMFS
ncbi:hypothetical protein GE061_007040 [Apolygus lucorum]|uniref:Peptidase S1 domain-containing protein n=1 Tax=Apolygus lucorum TaxID=248454 RepID=A0A8S9WQU0_APOLU|nr:hypothetical protein GE061_007040 [Apolygus lucorum]